MSAYEQGPLTQYGALNAGVVPLDVYGIAINWFVNRTPLFSRFPKAPLGSPHFNITVEGYRPRMVTLKTAIAATNTTSIDANENITHIEPGDVIEADGEAMLVTANSGTALTVTRGYGGTSAKSAIAKDTPIYLITNTRTGAETDVEAKSRTPETVIQYAQTIQHAYSVGGAAQANTNYVSAYGGPLDRDRMYALQHCVDDFESAMYYGLGVAVGSATAKPAMKGLASLITTNRKTTPTNASAYKPEDLVKDAIEPCFANGGAPNLMLVSTDFISGFAKWGHHVLRVNAGQNLFGTPIDLFQVSFLPGISIIPAPLLRSGSIITLNTSEIRNRMKRPLFDQERGKRGDATEGDMIMEGAIELDNQSHHAFVSGVTGFAVPA